MRPAGEGEGSTEGEMSGCFHCGQRVPLGPGEHAWGASTKDEGLGRSLSSSIHTQLLSEVWPASCSPGGRLDGELRVFAAGSWQGLNGDGQRVCQGGHVSFLTYSWAAGGPGA